MASDNKDNKKKPDPEKPGVAKSKAEREAAIAADRLQKTREANEKKARAAERKARDGGEGATEKPAPKRKSVEPTPAQRDLVEARAQDPDVISVDTGRVPLSVDDPTRAVRQMSEQAAKLVAAKETRTRQSQSRKTKKTTQQNLRELQDLPPEQAMNQLLALTRKAGGDVQAVEGVVNTELRKQQKAQEEQATKTTREKVITEIGEQLDSGRKPKPPVGDDDVEVGKGRELASGSLYPRRYLGSIRRARVERQRQGIPVRSSVSVRRTEQAPGATESTPVPATRTTDVSNTKMVPAGRSEGLDDDTSNWKTVPATVTQQVTRPTTRAERFEQTGETTTDIVTVPNLETPSPSSAFIASTTDPYLRAKRRQAALSGTVSKTTRIKRTKLETPGLRTARYAGEVLGLPSPLSTEERTDTGATLSQTFVGGKEALPGRPETGLPPGATVTSQLPSGKEADLLDIERATDIDLRNLMNPSKNVTPKRVSARSRGFATGVGSNADTVSFEDLAERASQTGMDVDEIVRSSLGTSVVADDEELRGLTVKGDDAPEAITTTRVKTASPESEAYRNEVLASIRETQSVLDKGGHSPAREEGLRAALADQLTHYSNMFGSAQGGPVTVRGGDTRTVPIIDAMREAKVKEAREAEAETRKQVEAGNLGTIEAAKQMGVPVKFKSETPPQPRSEIPGMPAGTRRGSVTIQGRQVPFTPKELETMTTTAGTPILDETEMGVNESGAAVSVYGKRVREAALPPVPQAKRMSASVKIPKRSAQSAARLANAVQFRKLITGSELPSSAVAVPSDYEVMPEPVPATRLEWGNVGVVRRRVEEGSTRGAGERWKPAKSIIRRKERLAAMSSATPAAAEQEAAMATRLSRASELGGVPQVRQQQRDVVAAQVAKPGIAKAIGAGGGLEQRAVGAGIGGITPEGVQSGGFDKPLESMGAMDVRRNEFRALGRGLAKEFGGIEPSSGLVRVPRMNQAGTAPLRGYRAGKFVELSDMVPIEQTEQVQVPRMNQAGTTQIQQMDESGQLRPVFETVRRRRSDSLGAGAQAGR